MCHGSCKFYHASHVLSLQPMTWPRAGEYLNHLKQWINSNKCIVMTTWNISWLVLLRINLLFCLRLEAAAAKTTGNLCCCCHCSLLFYCMYILPQMILFYVTKLFSFECIFVNMICYGHE